MALDKNKLTKDLQDTFEQSKKNQWDTATVAQHLAAAIDNYVTAAEVVGVRTDQNGTQTGKGKLQ